MRKLLLYGGVLVLFSAVFLYGQPAPIRTIFFWQLRDVPDSYSGEEGKYVRVNTGGTALEFGTPSGSGTITSVWNDSTGDVTQPVIGSGEYLDGGTATVDAASEGILLPRGADVSAATAEGQISWDSDNDRLYVGDGAAVVSIASSFDSTTVDATTWSDNANASNIWTFDVSGTDHTLTAGNGLMTFSHAVTVSGAVILGDGGDNFSIASDGIDIDTSGNITNAGTIGSGAITSTGTVEGATITEGGVAVHNNDQMDASSELAAIIDDETGTGVIVFGTSPTFTTSIITPLATHGTAIAIGDNTPTVAIDSSDWDISTTGVATGMGNITSDGTVEGATITEGGNAVYSSGETPSGELGGTYANITIDDSVAVSSWTLTTPTITSGATYTDADISPDAPGELVYDNTVTGILDGAFAWYDDDAIRYIVDLATLPTNDDYVVAYDADADGFYMKVDADSGGATAWDDISNPDAAATIDFVTYTQTIDIGVTDAGGPKSGLILDVTGLGAGATDVIALEITTATDDDTDYIPIAVYDDSGSNNDLLFKVDSLGGINFQHSGYVNQTVDNTIDFSDNSDTFRMNFDGTDCELQWSDGVFNIRGTEDGVDAIVEIEGKDGGEKGILRVLSDGDDNYIELHHDDTDGHIITDTGDIHIEANGGDILFADDNVTTTGTVEGATLTEGGNAVYSSGETPSGELGGTYANITIDDSVTVASWTIDSPTFTTGITATDLIDSAHYAADSIDNEHINWTNITNLGDNGLHTLDTAYNGGVSIDVDGSAVSMTVSDTDNNRVLEITQNEVTNANEAVLITSTSADNALMIDMNADAGNSESSGGAILIDSTGNVGIGLNVYSNAGSTVDGDLVNIFATNAAFDETVLRIKNDGVGNCILASQTITSGGATTAFSYNSDDVDNSTMGIGGDQDDKGTVKITHTKPAGADGSAAAISIDLAGNETTAMGLFIDSTGTPSTTGDLIELRDNASTVAEIQYTGLITSAVGLDAVGAVDFDIGSDDVVDITLITDGGTFIFDNGLTAVGEDLGSTAAEWNDLFLNDGGVIQLGNDQDVTLTHVADTGVQVELDDMIMFGDTAVYIHSDDDGFLDIEADTGIRMDGPVDMQANALDLDSCTTTLSTVAGTIDAGGATSLEIPNGADPDVSVVGQLHLDTDGGNEPNDVSLRTFEGAGTQYVLARTLKTLNFTLIEPDQIDAYDLIPVWHNTSGYTFTITEWKAWSDDDDVSFEIEELTDMTDFTAITQVDACEVATNGTSVFYGSDTTITHAAVEHDHSIAIDFDGATDTPDYVQISITGWFNGDVN